MPSKVREELWGINFRAVQLINTELRVLRAAVENASCFRHMTRASSSTSTLMKSYSCSDLSVLPPRHPSRSSCTSLRPSTKTKKKQNKKKHFSLYRFWNHKVTNISHIKKKRWNRRKWSARSRFDLNCFLTVKGFRRKVVDVTSRNLVQVRNIRLFIRRAFFPPLHWSLSPSTAKCSYLTTTGRRLKTCRYCVASIDFSQECFTFLGDAKKPAKDSQLEPAANHCCLCFL